MDLKEALETLRTLAEGRDPTNGELLPPDHVCQRPPVIRALFEAIRLLERRAGSGRNQGRSWTLDEEQQLCERYDQGVPLLDIAERHERSRSAIVARLVMLGKIAPDSPEAFSLRYRGLGKS